MLARCGSANASQRNVRPPIERTPLSTRLLSGHETNLVLGSIRITSSEGSSIRTYLAAVAPPQPPPITITRRPEVGARSDGVDVAVRAALPAQPANPEAATAAPLEALRQSLRLLRAMTYPSNCHGRWTATVRYNGSGRYGV